MQLVVRDGRGDVVCYSGDLGEVALREAFPGRATHDVVGGVLVGVGCFVAGGVDDFKDGVDAEAGVGVDGDAFSVFERLREVGGVDAAGEEESGVVVYGFVVDHWRD